MSLVVYKPGNATIVRGVPCQKFVISSDGVTRESLEKSGYFLSLDHLKKQYLKLKELKEKKKK